MELIIDIPEETFKYYVTLANKGEQIGNLERIVLDGTPLPEHHGDLIDRNELLDESYQIDSMYCEYDEVVNVDDIKDAPIIIEGSDSK